MDFRGAHRPRRGQPGRIPDPLGLPETGGAAAGARSLPDPHALLRVQGRSSRAALRGHRAGAQLPAWAFRELWAGPRVAQQRFEGLLVAPMLLVPDAYRFRTGQTAGPGVENGWHAGSHCPGRKWAPVPRLPSGPLLKVTDNVTKPGQPRGEQVAAK